MVEVKVKNNDIETALKKLKRKYEREIKEDLRKHYRGFSSFGYLTRGERNRKKRMLGRARWKQRQQLQKQKDGE